MVWLWVENASVGEDGVCVRLNTWAVALAKETAVRAVGEAGARAQNVRVREGVGVRDGTVSASSVDAENDVNPLVSCERMARMTRTMQQPICQWMAHLYRCSVNVTMMRT